MIKTSGYRVSPTEIEEVAYDTGLVRDAVALGVDDPALGQRIVLFAAPRTGGDLDVDALLAAMRKRSSRSTWSPRRGPSATSCPGPRTASSTATAPRGRHGSGAADAEVGP